MTQQSQPDNSEQMPDRKPKKTIEIKPEGTDAEGVLLFAKRKLVHPRSITGVFNTWRWIFVWLTQLFFYGIPWMNWGGRQMLLFDIAGRRFYLFGTVLYPQDFIFLTGLLVICALSLFLFTAVSGRLWCGFACPQTVYTELFLWIQNKVEGDRSARIRLDNSPWNAEKIRKRGLRWFLWAAVSLWTGFTFVGYFTPIRELFSDLIHFQMAGWSLFWTLFYGALTLGNAGRMREQFCTYLCPYARFQSAMFDHDTLLVSYDAARGEPRGPRNKATADYKAKGLGDCIDCTLCVQVCPVGIDIRDGLQYTCIGCGLCVDACDSVMDKMGYPHGLVRLTTQNGLEKGWNTRQIWRHIFRPRILIYAGIISVVATVVLSSLFLRAPLKVNIVRDRAAMARIIDGRELENVYRLQIMNSTEKQQTYRISAHGLDGMYMDTNDTITIDPVKAEQVVVRLRLPRAEAQAGSHKIFFEVQEQGSNAKVSEKSVFMVPERRR